MPKRVCSELNATGGPCGRPPQIGKPTCAAHDPDPEVRAAFQAAQVRGLMASQGRDRSTGVPLADLPRLATSEGRLDALQRAYEAMLAGTLSVVKAKAVPQLVRAAAEESNPDALAGLERQVEALMAEVERRGRNAWE